MAFTENESYKHKKAKEVLKEWFCDGGACGLHFTPNRKCGVFLEYPIVTDIFEKSDWLGRETENEINSVRMNWDEILGSNDEEVPTYEYCYEKGWFPKRVIDVVLPHKGVPLYYIEVCHTNPVSKKKIKELAECGVCNLLEVDAEWVLRQTKEPKKLECKILIDEYGNYNGDKDVEKVKPQERPNITIKEWNTLVEHAKELDKISQQKSKELQGQKERIATLKKENKELKARLEAIKVACS